MSLKFNSILYTLQKFCLKLACLIVRNLLIVNLIVVNTIRKFKILQLELNLSIQLE